MSQNQEQTDSRRSLKNVRKDLGSYFSLDEVQATVDSIKGQFPEASTFEFSAEDGYYGGQTIYLSFYRYETEKERQEREQMNELYKKRQEESDRLKYQELKRKFENG